MKVLLSLFFAEQRGKKIASKFASKIISLQRKTVEKQYFLKLKQYKCHFTMLINYISLMF